MFYTDFSNTRLRVSLIQAASMKRWSKIANRTFQKWHRQRHTKLRLWLSSDTITSKPWHESSYNHRQWQR